MQKKKDTYFKQYTKINSKMDQRPKRRTKTMKLLKKHREMSS